MDPIFDKIVSASKENRRFVFCLMISTEGSTPRKIATKMLVYPDGTIEGTIGGGQLEVKVIEDALAVMKDGNPITKSYELEDDLTMHCGGKAEVYFEPVTPALKLFIFGAGHVGRALAALAAGFGFEIFLFDDRDGIFNDLHLPNCHFLQGDYMESIENAPFDDDTYIVVVTPKHKYDESILRITAHKPHNYLGVMGSQEKIATMRSNILKDGVLTSEEMDKVNMPIGLKFNAQTPVEIAVSIIAKIIDVKNNGNGQ